MDGRNNDQEGTDDARGARTGPDETHTEGGAPTDKAHEEAGDGSLTGSVPAGLTPEELEKVAEKDRDVEPGTG